MPHIPEQVIEEVAVRADIIEVVQSYGVVLKQAGSRWKGCCPFHHEKTPSFMVNPGSNTYHCFGCGAGGSVFKFVMNIDNLSFPDAVRQLARKYNVIIPEPEPWHGGPHANISQDPNYSLRERLFSLHEKLANWYMSYLKNNPDSKAAEYFRSRNLDPARALQFMIGAAPDSWDAVMNWAQHEGFTLDELKAVHLVSESQKTPGKYFDFFRNRLIFPIWNEQGRVVGFSARQIDKEQGGGKYVNSVESPIFKKGRLLYGLNFARPNIPQAGCVILCEGQMDVIAMHTAGCTNAVAPQGTAFTEDQASILRRYTDTILLATDADTAGMKAILKDAAILLPHGFSLKVVSFPGGKDPDELLHNSGAESVKKAVSEAVDFFEFLFNRSASEHDPASPDGKVRIAAALLSYLRLVENEVARDSYLNWLAGKLDLSVNALYDELNKRNTHEKKYAMPERPLPDDHESASPESLPGSMTDAHFAVLLKEILQAALGCRNCADLLSRELPPDYLDDGPVAVALTALIQAHLNNEWDNVQSKISLALTTCPYDCPEEINTLLTVELKEVQEEFAMKIVRDNLRSIRRKHVEEQIASVKKLLSELPTGGEREEALKEFLELTRMLMKI